jgi:hypothetical protein
VQIEIPLSLKNPFSFYTKRSIFLVVDVFIRYRQQVFNFKKPLIKEGIMFCPNCKAEYKEGILRCAECDVDLVSELPPEPEDIPEYVDWEDLISFADKYEADLAQGLLEANNIEAVTVSDDCGSVYPSMTYVHGIRLMVKKEDLEAAKEVLLDAEYKL